MTRVGKESSKGVHAMTGMAWPGSIRGIRGSTSMAWPGSRQICPLLDLFPGTNDHLSGIE